MAVVDVRPGLEALSYRVSPNPSMVLEISPTLSADKVAAQVTSAFLSQRKGADLPLEYRNPFGNWRPFSDEEAVEQLIASVGNAFKLRDSMDVSRGIAGIQVATYEGLSGWRVLQKLVFGSAWLFKLNIEGWTKLGQGGAVYSRGEGFSMTQRPAIHPEKSQTLIRALRTP